MSGKSGMVPTPAHLRVEDRTCETCGDPMKRRVGPSGKLESWVAYRSRRFCSQRCGAISSAPARAKDTAEKQPVPHRRTLLAKTCHKCGELRPGSSFPLNGRKSGRVADCNTCRRHKKLSNPETRRRVFASAYAWKSRINDEFVDGSAHGRYWTGAQLQVASREDLTVVEAAGLLGRTPFAVQEVRNRLRREPALRARMDCAI